MYLAGRAPFKFSIRCLNARSRKVSKPRDLFLEFSDRSEVWQAPRQQGWRWFCQTLKRFDKLYYYSRGFETSRDLTIFTVMNPSDSSKVPGWLLLADTVVFNFCGHQLIFPWTKWSPFRQTTISDTLSWLKIIEFRFKFHWNLFLGVRCQIDNRPAYQRTGDKPLTEPLLTQFTDDGAGGSGKWTRGYFPTLSRRAMLNEMPDWGLRGLWVTSCKITMISRGSAQPVPVWVFLGRGQFISIITVTS